MTVTNRTCIHEEITPSSYPVMSSREVWHSWTKHQHGPTFPAKLHHWPRYPCTGFIQEQNMYFLLKRFTSYSLGIYPSLSSYCSVLSQTLLISILNTQRVYSSKTLVYKHNISWCAHAEDHNWTLSSWHCKNVHCSKLCYARKYKFLVSLIRTGLERYVTKV